MTPDPWFDFWPKLLVNVAGGIVLSLGAAFFTLMLSRYLERFRRQQSIVAELLKARIAAVNASVSAVLELHAALAADEEEAQLGREIAESTMSKTAFKALTHATDLLEQNRWLLGNGLASAIGDYLLDAKRCVDRIAESRDMGENWTAVSAHREEVLNAIPSFARLPPEEIPKLKEPKRLQNRGKE